MIYTYETGRMQSSERKEVLKPRYSPAELGYNFNPRRLSTEFPLWEPLRTQGHLYVCDDDLVDLNLPYWFRPKWDRDYLMIYVPKGVYHNNIRAATMNALPIAAGEERYAEPGLCSRPFVLVWALHTGFTLTVVQTTSEQIPPVVHPSDGIGHHTETVVVFNSDEGVSVHESSLLPVAG